MTTATPGTMAATSRSPTEAALRKSITSGSTTTAGPTRHSRSIITTSPRTGGHPANPEERRGLDPIPEVALKPAETSLLPTVPLSSPIQHKSSPQAQSQKHRRPAQPRARTQPHPGSPGDRRATHARPGRPASKESSRRPPGPRPSPGPALRAATPLGARSPDPPDPPRSTAKPGSTTKTLTRKVIKSTKTISVAFIGTARPEVG